MPFRLVEQARPFFRVVNVGAHPGGDAFLLLGEGVSLVCDTGFAFSAAQTLENLERALDGRPLDYMLLTHSHYDHALGAPRLAARWPQARIVASGYAQRVFAKDSARAVMRQMDAAAASLFGAEPDGQAGEGLRVDLPVEDGMRLHLGPLEVEAVALPGHTRCSMGFFFPEGRLLLGTETLGVFTEGEMVVPAFLVGYQMTLDSFERAAALAPEAILVPHRGLICWADCARYLRLGRACAVDCRETIVRLYREGKTQEEIIEAMRLRYHSGLIARIQPWPAFRLNAEATVPMVLREAGLL